MTIFAILFALAGLPVIERAPTAGHNDAFAIFLTGDGGWRRVDERVSDRLRANGIPVAGFITSDYYRTRHTPEESARAVERVIRAYQSKWGKRDLILIGYSRGADVLPFIASRLPADIHPKLVVLIGIERMIDFKYDPPWALAHWFSHEPEVPTAPEAAKLRGLNVMCVYGVEESDSLCPSLDPKYFSIVPEPGGHHFGGRYAEIGDAIVSSLERSR